MIGIIGAMDVEVQALIRALESPVSVVISGRTYHSGRLGANDVVVVRSGVGKVNAAMCAEALILTYRPDIVINCGVAGSLTEELHICDLAIGSSVLQYDVDTTAVGDPLGFVSTVGRIRFPCDGTVSDLLERTAARSGARTLRGTIASGDRFVTTEWHRFIAEHFPDCIASEMEAGAVAQVCTVNGVRFAVARAISDRSNDRSEQDYPAFVSTAAERAARVLLGLLALPL